MPRHADLPAAAVAAPVEPSLDVLHTASGPAHSANMYTALIEIQTWLRELHQALPRAAAPDTSEGARP